MDDNMKLIIPCPKCKERIPRGLYTYKATPNDPLAEMLYCPKCHTAFFFTDLSHILHYED